MAEPEIIRDFRTKIDSIAEIDPNKWYRPWVLANTQEFRHLHHPHYIYYIIKRGAFVILTLTNGGAKLIKGQEFIDFLT